ncbi:MAG: SMC family ATPase [Nocardioidaceae bacterium]
MRLHRLEITAFGPFADTVTVDFDALSASGLFLLTGATGAGKTSVLDAVCFALYGDVPGDRSTARRLRSDQAAADTPPRVVLDCTLAGRRFTVTRSPAWQRPKKRGAGTTQQQASVTVTERVDGTWVPLSSRLDEAGHLVSELVGMTMTQFTQVAMLPQGRFQTFLRARSEERHKLLQQLFRTGRFEQVERWLRDHRLALTATSRIHQREVADVVSRLSEAADVPCPEPWDPHDLAPVAESGEVAAWAARIAGQSRHTATRAREAAAVAARDAEAGTTALQSGRELARLQAEHARATSVLADLEGRAPQVQALRDRVEAARRAAAVLPVAALEAEARDAWAAAESAVVTARRSAPRHLAALETVDELVAARDELTRRAAEVTALLPRARRLEGLRRQATDDAQTIDALIDQVARLAEDEAGLPRLLAAARTRHHDALLAGDRRRAVDETVARIDTRLAAAREHAGLLAQLVLAEDEQRSAKDVVLSLKEHWLAVQEERITGMAAELAGRLAVGASCPVCGSDDHPHPAETRAGAADATAEKIARSRLDDAETALHLHDERVRDLATRIAVTTERAEGAEVAALEAERQRAAEEQSSLASTAASADDAAATLADLEQHANDLGAQRTALVTRLAALRSASEARDVEITTIEAELDAAVGAGGDVASVARRASAEAATVGELADSLRVRQAADTAHRVAARHASTAALEAGFDDVASARSHAMGDRALVDATRSVGDHDAALAAARALVEDPELARLAHEPAPDVPALEAHALATGARLTEAAAAAELSGRRAGRVDGLVEALDAALARWEPVRDELDLATGMASFAEGRSPDNRLQMRLSAYVLAHRLAQVVAAANARLATMSDRRYTLEHTGRKGAGETRGGLSLLVRDDWSGEARDPATLSGGETFVVSLALALGLADVIIHEVGRADLETLFVDEGFGSLDADTLDDVMDTLDSLRDGGRVVGVVSHVAEMQDRIPTQLAVRKRRRGSTLALVRA